MKYSFKIYFSLRGCIIFGNNTSFFKKKKLTDYFIYSTCKKVFWGQKYYTQYSESAVNTPPLFWRCILDVDFWKKFLSWRLKVFHVPFCISQSASDGRLTTPTGTVQRTLWHLGGGKYHPAQLEIWNCSSHQRVHFHESSSCYRFHSLESLQFKLALRSQLEFLSYMELL